MSAMETQELQLDDTQLKAIELSCDTTKRIVSVTGQAGTGKTTILVRVYNALIAMGYRVVLCAPTGKAAKRITEVTGIPAMTQHRMLEYPHPGERDAKTGNALRTTEPKRNRFNRLEYDVVLADEYAMVNHEVNRNIIDALPDAGCLRCFGDVNQLPPIENLKVYKDKPSPFTGMLDEFPSVRLTTIHRQAEGSGIIFNADKILNGRMPQRHEDFALRITTQPVNSLRDLLDEMQGIADFSHPDNQIISPTRKRWVGTAALNAMMQSIYRPESDGWLSLPRHSWADDKYTRVRPGDKIIWTQNNYDLGIFNGETGLVVSVDQEIGSLCIDFGDKVVDVPPIVQYVRPNGSNGEFDPRKDIDLAYCVTTHKAQGSEYAYVVYIINRSIFYLLNRNNFYTGVTRASKHVTVITDQQGLQTSVSRRVESSGGK